MYVCMKEIKITNYSESLLICLLEKFNKLGLLSEKNVLKGYS